MISVVDQLELVYFMRFLIYKITAFGALWWWPIEVPFDFKQEIAYAGERCSISYNINQVRK